MRVEKSGQFQRQRRELPRLAMVGGIHAWSAATLHGGGAVPRLKMSSSAMIILS